MTPKFKNDFRIAINAVWIIISLIIITVLILSVKYPETLLGIAPVCFSKTFYNSECFMCGMTRAFTEISKGNFSHALKLNYLSLIFYISFAVNIAAFIFYLLKKMKSTIFISKKHLTH